jgi:hypothetical protein
VEQLDRGGQGDAFFRRDVEAFGQPEAEAGAVAEGLSGLVREMASFRASLRVGAGAPDRAPPRFPALV